MKKIIAGIYTTLAILGFSHNFHAHPSSASHYFLDQSITLEGTTVTKWALINPHSYIYFILTSPVTGAVINWCCEGSSRNALPRLGYADDTFAAETA